MTSLLLIALSLSIPWSLPSESWAFGGDEVGNGAGLAENQILYMNSRLEDFTHLCLKSESCHLTQKEVDVLTRIESSLFTERQMGTSIAFKSHFKEPIFFIDGKIRAAKTWNEIGTPILFNLDLLYREKSPGAFEAISLATSLSLLVHEFGHHQGILDHDFLDQLGGKVARRLDGRVFQSILNPEDDMIQATIIYFDHLSPSPSNISHLIISDGIQLFDLTHSVTAQFICPTIQGQKSHLVGLSLWNGIWRQIYSPTPYFLSYAKMHCSLDSEPKKIFSISGLGVKVSVSLVQRDTRPTLLENSLRVQITTCPEEPLICDWAKANHRLQTQIIPIVRNN